MPRPSPVREKSYAFALSVVRFCRDYRHPNTRSVAHQFLRAGTSVGANVEESTAAQSRSDFLTKITIASKEAREARYWIRLLRDAELMDRNQATELYSMAEELVRLLTAIAKTTRQNNEATIPHFNGRSCAGTRNSKLKTQNSKLLSGGQV